MTSRKTLWMAGIALGIVTLLLALVGPVRISISITRENDAALAAPPADLPTITPPAPTNVPAHSDPTTTPLPQPSPEAATPAPTEPPARHEREQPTPTQTEITPEPTADPRRPNVAIEKRANRAEARTGDQVRFTLLVTNYGDAAAADVVVSDMVPSELEVVDLHSSRGDIVVDGQTVTAYPRSLQPGESASYEIVTRVRRQAQAGVLRNTAIVTTSTHGDDPGNNTSTTTVSIVRPAETHQPTRLPITGDELVEEPVLLRMWPLVVLALGAMVFGVAMRHGSLRGQIVQVTFERQEAEQRHALALDHADLARRWHAGTPFRELVQRACVDNPGVDPTLVALAINRLLRQALG